MKKESLVYDVIYNPIKTLLLQEAENCGLRTVNGLDMLIYQGAKALEIWTGKYPDVKDIAIAGGVSANSGLRKAFQSFAESRGLNCFIPRLSFTMDNAAMIGVAASYKWEENDFCDLSLPPFARIEI